MTTNRQLAAFLRDVAAGLDHTPTMPAPCGIDDVLALLNGELTRDDDDQAGETDAPAPCSRCRGRGFVGDVELFCSRCDGSGTMPKV